MFGAAHCEHRHVSFSDKLDWNGEIDCFENNPKSNIGLRAAVQIFDLVKGPGPFEHASRMSAFSDYFTISVPCTTEILPHFL